MSVVPGLGWPVVAAPDRLPDAAATEETPVGWQGDVPRETLAEPRSTRPTEEDTAR